MEKKSEVFAKVGSDDEIEQDGTSRANLKQTRVNFLSLRHLKQIYINEKTFLIGLDQERDRELLEL